MALGLVLLLALADVASAAESFKAAAAEFNAARAVTIMDDPVPSVVVTEFLHHGQIDADGRNVVVVAKNHELAPARVLQLGPGDFCRLAFEPIKNQTRYRILYGGPPPSADKLPKWTSRDGLLLETRVFAPCDLHNFDAVRRAFESAKPLGADYVDTVQHAANPCRLEPGPFMSRYHGRLRIRKAGKYTFWTSSHDCSFLLIDGKVVVAAPGRHGPAYQARPGSGRDVDLTAGVHEFEYYHVATGHRTMMVAAALLKPYPNSARPALIPPERFRAETIARVEPGPPSSRKGRVVPDFTFTITGDVPLPARPRPLVAVMFHDNSPRSLMNTTTARWDFGDGQTSNEKNPTHVFLKPGLYEVKLSRRRGSKTVSLANQIDVQRPIRTRHTKKKAHELDDYLPVVETYDPETLDVDSAGQLVAAYLFKAEVLQEQLDKLLATIAAQDAAETADQKTPAKRKGRTKATGRAEDPDELAADVRLYRQKAVAVGHAALASKFALGDDRVRFELARTIAPIARFDLGDSKTALGIWEDAAGRITNRRTRAECQLYAADIAIGDLLDAPRGRRLVDAAAGDIGSKPSPQASRLQRVLGDYHALAGDVTQARKAYAEAERLLSDRRKHIERTAHRGARSRSTEKFLQSADWPAAARELQRWQDEFPSDKMGGYLSLLYARYWIGREQHAQAAALAEGLVAVNPDSPYADQLLYLAARCQSRRGRTARAVALLNQLLQDYPGSPLAPEVKRRLGKQ